MKKSYLLTAVFLISSAFMSSDKEDKISAQETINPNTSWPQVQYDENRSGYVSQTVVGPFSLEWVTCSKRHWKEISQANPEKTFDEILSDCETKTREINNNQNIKVLPPLGEDKNSIVESNFGVSHRVQPIVAEGKVFIPSNNGILYAFNDSDGSIAWKFPNVDNNENPIGPLTGSVGYHNGKIYFGSTDKNIYAVNSSDGTLAKKYKTDGMIRSAPLIADSKVFIGSRDGFMYAFDLNLNFKWKTDTKAPIEDAPAYSDGKIFFGNMASKAFGLDANTGNITFERQLSGQGFKDRWTVARDGKAYFRPLPKDHHKSIATGTYLFHDLSNNKDEHGNMIPDGNANTSGLEEEEIWGDSWSVQRQAIINKINENEENRTFYTVNTSDGNNYFNEPAPLMYFSGGGGSQGVPPVLLPDGKAFVNYRRTFETPSKYGATTNHALYTGKLVDNNKTADIEVFEHCPNGVDDDKCIKSSNSNFKSKHISDESDAMTVAGNSLLLNNSRTLTIMNKDKQGTETVFRNIVCYDGPCLEISSNLLFNFGDYAGQGSNGSLNSDMGWRIGYGSNGEEEFRHVFSEVNSDGNNSSGVPPIIVGEYIYILHYNSLVKIKGKIVNN